MLQGGLRRLRESGLTKSGDVVVAVFGTSALPGAANMIKVHAF